MRKIKNCFCGRLKPFEECCGLILKGDKEASTAEELMRSRYSAFVKADVDYLMKSYHSTTRPLSEKKEIKVWVDSVIWLHLQILSTNKGGVSDIEGTVVFKASFLEEGDVKVISENSIFEKEKGKWRYLKEYEPNE